MSDFPIRFTIVPTRAWQEFPAHYSLWPEVLQSKLRHNALSGVLSAYTPYACSLEGHQQESPFQPAGLTRTILRPFTRQQNASHAATVHPDFGPSERRGGNQKACTRDVSPLLFLTIIRTSYRKKSNAHRGKLNAAFPALCDGTERHKNLDSKP
jgi:hypothetical protein